MRFRNAPEADLRGGATLADTFAAARKEAWHSLNLDLQTVTPVYGGGVEAGQVDEHLPFRPRALRNGIRHWWWLLNRARFRDSAELYAEMAYLWGAASGEGEDGTSKVRVMPTSIPANLRRTAYAPYRVEPGRSNPRPRASQDFRHPYTYALFGARGQLQSRIPMPTLDRLVPLSAKLYPRNAPYDWNQGQCEYFQTLASCAELWKEPPGTLILPGARFSLRIDISRALSEERKESVLDAIHAWLAIGGLGARTSRGLGKLALQNGTMPDDLAGRTMSGMQIVKSVRLFQSAEQAMLKALATYQSFRQARSGFGSQNPGRSYWPDADTVRASTGHALAIQGQGIVHAVEHPGSPAPDDLESSDNYWSLSKLFFGAPVIMKFKDDGAFPVNGATAFDPPATTLSLGSVGAALDRFGSPVLTIALSEANGFRAAIVVLPYEGDLAGKEGFIGTRRIGWDAWWPRGPAAAEQVLNQCGTQLGDPLLRSVQAATVGCADPIQAFIKFAQGQLK
jgi:CRISPR-associated protein Cmr1